MADSEVVRRLTISATSEGVADATSAVNQLADSITNVAEVTDTSAKQQVSAQSAYDKQTRAVVDGAAAHAKYQSAVKVANTALNQGIITNDQYAARVDVLKTKYLGAGAGANAFQKAIDGITGKLNEFSGKTGVIGEVLSAIGPEGLVAAAGVGALYLAYEKLSEIATEQGQWARQLTEVAQTVGITTTQLQGLNEVASQAGLTNESFSNGLFRMTQQLAQLKQGSGTLFDQLSKGNTELRNQLSLTKDSAAQIDILAKAYANAGEEQRKLMLAGFGRGGQGQAFGRVLDQVNAQGGVQGAVDANSADTIPLEQIQRWNELQKAIASATESAKHNFASIFTDQVLSGQKDFAEGMQEISRWAKNFALSDDWKDFTTWLAKPETKIGLSALALGIAVMTGGTAAVLVGGAIAAGAAYSATSGVKTGSLVNPQEQVAPKGDKLTSPNIDQTFGDITKGNLAVQAKDASILVQQLGAAATATEKYNATIAQTNSLLEQNDLRGGKATADRITAMAALERDIALQQLHNSALGNAASTAELLTAKQQTLDKERKLGANISDTEYATQLRLTQENSDGISQIDALVKAEQIKIATYGMSAEKAIAYATAQAEINKQLANGRTVINRAGINASANTYAQNKIKDDQMSIASDISRDRQKGLLTQEDADIADKLKTLYKDDIPAALNSTYAAQMRFNNGLKDTGTYINSTIDSLGPALRDSINDIHNAGDAFKAFGLTAVKALEDLILKLMILKPLEQAIGGSLGGMFGGGTVSSAVGDATKLSGLYASGTDYASGGLSLVGEEGPELVNLPKGASVTPNKQTMAALGGGQVTATFAPTYNVTGNTQDIEALRAQMADDRASFEAKTIATIRKAQRTRTL